MSLSGSSMHDVGQLMRALRQNDLYRHRILAGFMRQHNRRSPCNALLLATYSNAKRVARPTGPWAHGCALHDECAGLD